MNTSEFFCQNCQMYVPCDCEYTEELAEIHDVEPEDLGGAVEYWEDDGGS